MKKTIYILTLLLLFMFVKISADNIYTQNPKSPSYFMQMLQPSINIKNQFPLNNTINKGDSNYVSVVPHVKKQNINKVSQKQYEIINMLWRKTKIFVDIEASTVTYQPRYMTTQRKFYSTTEHKNSFQVSLSRPLLQISTPSYIEFYYIHEIDDQVKEKKSASFNIDIRIAAKRGLKNNTKLEASKSLYGFSNHHVETVSTPPQQLTYNNLRPKEKSNFIYYVDFFTHKTALLFNKSKSNNAKAATKNKSQQKDVTSIDMFFGNETCPYTTLQADEVSYRSKDIKSIKSKNTNNYEIKSHRLHSKNLSPEENKSTHERILLQHLDENTKNNYGPEMKTKHVKKHIDIGAKTTNGIQNKHLKQDARLATKLFNKINNENESLNISSYELNVEFANRKISHNYVNSSVSWSVYRFVAVYVYEPLQVHCDAAGISPHWLITAGSCLARHHKNPGGEGLSAYVSYCGDNWWDPERISYVKYSRVHPRYHPRNRIRRHLYNIGIIQVVNSMTSACPGWSPVSLMSHHFSTSGIGSRATAIGWGLDRFDTSYTVTYLPKRPLTMYNALLYSDSCPGNIGYSKAKQLEDEGGVRNVYCLALPPYNGEENDPVHGALLLVEEKLIALYLQPTYYGSSDCLGSVVVSQYACNAEVSGSSPESGKVILNFSFSISPKSGICARYGDRLATWDGYIRRKVGALTGPEERRPWGEQSALYTGTWRLVPWVLDNARESEESDIFTVDI